jgi:class 3 adenylate cyclase/hemoglobin-like flavoprotein
METSGLHSQSIDVADPDVIRKIQEGNRLVQRTWSEAKTVPNFTLRLLDRLWALDANLADSLFFHTTREKQAERLGSMLNEAIQLLDKPDAFMPVMMQLGVKHILYGVGDLHMDVFGGLLIAHLEATFKPPLTPWSDELAREWKRAFGLMKSLMAQGRSTIRDTRRYGAQTHRIVLRCWRSVTDREDTGLETSFVEVLYERGAAAIGVKRAGILVNLVARRRIFMDMMTRLFEIGLNDTEAHHLLHELGARHVTYGLSDSEYTALTNPFVEAVVECSRPSTMTPQIYQLMKAFWNECSRLMLEGAAQSRCSFTLRLAPKDTPFAIVFTDIEGSTALWEAQSLVMDQAVDEHHKLVRDLIHDHNGYEVKTIGDSFMIAFRGLADAVTMALRLQVELLRASVDGLQIDGTKCEASGPPEMWNPSALRVRVGVHWCTDATPKFDAVYKRYDYYGNDVNVASRVQDAACGGQVMCTEATLKALHALAGPMHEETFSLAKLQTLNTHSYIPGSKASLSDVLETSIYMADATLRGKAELKGVQEPLTLHSLYPKVLGGRVCGTRKKDALSKQSSLHLH